jgi:hypothetical protein
VAHRSVHARLQLLRPPLAGGSTGYELVDGPTLPIFEFPQESLGPDAVHHGAIVSEKVDGDGSEKVDGDGRHGDNNDADGLATGTRREKW